MTLIFAIMVVLSITTSPLQTFFSTRFALAKIIERHGPGQKQSIQSGNQSLESGRYLTPEFQPECRVRRVISGHGSLDAIDASRRRQAKLCKSYRDRTSATPSSYHPAILPFHQMPSLSLVPVLLER